MDILPYDGDTYMWDYQEFMLKQHYLHAYENHKFDKEC